MIYLYVKKHNKTGLKYLGQTKRKNPFTYNGSGKYWTRHIKKHGYDVKTIILLEIECINELERVSRFFSDFFDVVNSPDWANIIPETGIDINGINETGKNIYGMNGKTPNVVHDLKRGIEKQKYLWKNDNEWAENRRKNLSNSMRKWLENNDPIWLGKTHSEKSIQKQKKTFEEIKHQSGEKNSQYGTMWIHSVVEKRNKKIKKTENIPEGWEKGRKMKF